MRFIKRTSRRAKLLVYSLASPKVCTSVQQCLETCPLPTNKDPILSKICWQIDLLIWLVSPFLGVFRRKPKGFKAVLILIPSRLVKGQIVSALHIVHNAQTSQFKFFILGFKITQSAHCALSPQVFYSAISWGEIRQTYEQWGQSSNRSPLRHCRDRQWRFDILREVWQADGIHNQEHVGEYYCHMKDYCWIVLVVNGTMCERKKSLYSSLEVQTSMPVRLCMSDGCLAVS